MSYESERRLFHVMNKAGWHYDPATGGFRKGGDLWVSWGQAEGALRLADEGETAAGAVGQSRTLATIIHAADNENGRHDG